jgi:hypothetical protein
MNDFDRFRPLVIIYDRYNAQERSKMVMKRPKSFTINKFKNDIESS